MDQDQKEVMEKKILIILTPGFPKDEADSTCLPTQQLFVRKATELFPALDIKVITLQYPCRTLPYKWHGVDVYPLNGRRNRGILRVVTWYRCYRLLQRYNMKNLLGVLSFWCNETALIGNLFARRNNFQHKIWISGQDARRANRFVKLISPRPADLVAMSAFLKTEFLKNHGVEPAHILSNSTDITFTPKAKDIDVIGAGSLIPLKQYNIFLEVVGELRKRHPEISAIIFGKGSEEQSLRKMIFKLGLSSNVMLKGETNHTDLMEWMSRSKVLLHPSAYEGYSTVCLEALANGCHVVSFTHAENQPVPHWHIVKDKSMMIEKVERLLTSESDFSSVQTHHMSVTVQQMISLFDPGHSQQQ